MLHDMTLRSAPFRKIAEGTKTVELRLYDEKRRRVAVGDTICFRELQSGQTVCCEVTALYRFPSFEALYQKLDPAAIGYAPDEPSDPRDMLAYYPAEDIARYGVVGIGIKLCSPEI